MELSPVKIYVQGLTTDPRECDLVWTQGLGRCNQVTMRSYWIRVGPNPKTGVLVKTESLDTNTEAHGRMPFENRGRDWRVVSTSQGEPGMAGDRQEPGERPGAGSPSGPLERTNPANLWILDSGVHDCERINSCYFTPASFWFFVMAALGN